MEPSAEIDGLIARHPDWRGDALAEARRVILSVDDGIVEGWKYMGSPPGISTGRSSSATSSKRK